MHHPGQSAPPSIPHPQQASLRGRGMGSLGYQVPCTPQGPLAVYLVLSFPCADHVLEMTPVPHQPGLRSPSLRTRYATFTFLSLLFYPYFFFPLSPSIYLPTELLVIHHTQLKCPCFPRQTEQAKKVLRRFISQDLILEDAGFHLGPFHEHPMCHKVSRQSTGLRAGASAPSSLANSERQAICP